MRTENGTVVLKCSARLLWYVNLNVGIICSYNVEGHIHSEICLDTCIKNMSVGNILRWLLSTRACIHDDTLHALPFWTHHSQRLRHWLRPGWVKRRRLVPTDTYLIRD